MAGSGADDPGRRLVVVAMGSNIDPAVHLPAACRRIAAVDGWTLVRCSPVYASAPVGRTDQPEFANAAVLIELPSATEPAAIKQTLRAIEAAGDRVRDPNDRHGPRTIDLDLTLVEGVVCDDPPLPDPDLAKRWFVAVPCGDVAPELVVPGDGRTLGQIAAGFERPSPSAIVLDR